MTSSILSVAIHTYHTTPLGYSAASSYISPMRIQYIRTVQIQPFIMAVSRLPPKRAAKRKPCEPIGKYDTRYHARATSWIIDEMSVRRAFWS
jgi:hypothetical protein